MERKFQFTAGEFYHIYNRGNDKRLLFMCEEDYLYFMKLLFLCNSTQRIHLRRLPRGFDLFDVERPDTLIDIGIYALMPNHFHLLVHEKHEGDISKCLQKLSTAFSMYLNKKYGRTGSPFEGTFRATHVDDDAYFQYLFSYIHLNPIKLIVPTWKESGIGDLLRAEEYLRHYQFSSYLDYIGKELRTCGRILNKAAFPFDALDKIEFRTLAEEWLTYKDEFTITGSRPLPDDQATI